MARFHTSLIEATGQPIVAVDASGTITFWNRAAAATFGWSREEATGRHVLEVVPTEPWCQHAAPAAAAMTRGERYSAEYHLRRRDGSWFPAIVTDTPVVAADGSVRAIISVTTDISELRAAQRQMSTLRQLVESSDDAIVSTDCDGRITTWNRAATALYGLTEDDVVGRDVGVLDHGSQRSSTERPLAEFVHDVLAGRALPLHVADRPQADGRSVHVSSSVSPIFDDDGVLIGTSIISRDVTEPVELRKAADADRERLEAAQQLARLGSFEFDSTTGLMLWSAEMYRIWGRDDRQPVGPSGYLEGAHPDDMAAVAAAMERSRAADEPVDITHRILRGDGEVRWVHVRYAASYSADGHRIVSGTVHDVTDAKLAEERLARLALHDPLTDLPNRTLVIDRLAHSLRRAERSGVPVTVLFVDVDRFKIINDGLGHVGGDRALVELTRRMQAVLRASDTLGRLAGDEFVVVAEDLASEAEARQLAERVVASVSGQLFIDHLELRPTVSVGVSRSGPESSASSMLHDADSAMYRAKRRGRNRYEMFDGDTGLDRAERLALSTALRRSIDDGDVRLVYQPIVELATGKVSGVEALVRWRYPAAHDYPTEAFITAAEESGLVMPLSELVGRRALAEFARLRACRRSIDGAWLSINLSARQLAQPALASWFEAQCQEFGVPFANVHLELTETALMEDIDASVSTLRQITALGIQVVIDDFGTGYSSLSYVRNLPVTNLKIDRSFVAGLGNDPHDEAIVTAMVALARALGLQVVAEGVETTGQLSRLTELGCHFAQGFLFSRPLEYTDLEDWLDTNAGRVELHSPATC